MSIPTCPHCYRKVIPSAGGTCPACGKNTNDRGDADPYKTLLGIRSGARLPAVCHNCGLPTRKVKKFMVSSEPQDTTFSAGLGSLMASFLEVFSFLNKLERMNKTVQVSLRLPTCDQCSRTLKRITPHYIDFDDHRIDLVVHVEFKKALQQHVSG
jgi:hypothetical protein